MELENDLKRITAHPRRHALWLNSLSYLEYRGFRKIVRSRSTREMSFDVLTHTAEEIRHCLFFKKQAIRLGGDEFRFFDTTTLLCPQDLRIYFFELDQKVTSHLARLDDHLKSGAAYSIVTWLIERRALSVYQVYDKVLQSSTAPFSLAGVLREELMHLNEIGKKAEDFLRAHGFDLLDFTSLEEKEFRQLWSSLEIAVSRHEETDSSRELA